MPIYAYRCADCGHAQDVLQKLSDPVLTVCPSCGAQAYQKQLTAAGFQLKGSGWYVTDFRGGNTGAPKKEGESPDAPAADAKAGEGAAGKPEAAGADKKGADKKAADSAAPAAPAKATPASSPPAASPAAPSSGSGS
jgi:putative FmdB family regulatory protein